MLDGLKLGLDQLKTCSLNENSTSSVLLFTDGQADSKTGVVELIKPSLLDIKGSCTIQTFGYGTDHDANFLRSIAETAQGEYYFLEKPDDIPDSFADALGGLLSVVAQNISLEIQPCSPNVTIKRILSTFPSSKTENGWKVSIPDLFGEESRDILVEIETQQSVESHQNLLVSSLSYFNVLSSTMETSPNHITVIERPTISTPASASEIVDQQRNRVLCAEALTNSRLLADSGKLEAARELLTRTIELLAASPTAKTSETAQLIADLTEAKSLMKEKTTYTSLGSKKVQMSEQGHHKQRSKAPNYSNKVKCSMKAESKSSQESMSPERYERRAQAQQKQTVVSPNPNVSSNKKRQQQNKESF